jgi:hypothetical protein
MKTFYDFIDDSRISTFELQSLNENLVSELTEDQQIEIDRAIDRFVSEYLENGKTITDLEKDIMTEGFIGSIIGGLTGFALGNTIGKIVARVLGVQSGILYDLLTSRLVGAAVGAALGKRI